MPDDKVDPTWPLVGTPKWPEHSRTYPMLMRTRCGCTCTQYGTVRYVAFPNESFSDDPPNFGP